MKLRPLAVPDAFEIVPQAFSDDRGTFHEWYRHEAVADAVGARLDLAQANCSVSRAGTVRGIHFADVPPGQAKYVTCLNGAVLDVVVDVRVGSPTFGTWDAVRLDTDTRAAVYVAEGLGHAFCALTDDAVVVYLCNEVYNPSRERAIDPRDPDLAIAWPSGLELLLSDKDAAAPGLAQALADGLLPDHAACQSWYQRHR